MLIAGTRQARARGRPEGSRWSDRLRLEGRAPMGLRAVGVLERGVNPVERHASVAGVGQALGAGN